MFASGIGPISVAAFSLSTMFIAVPTGVNMVDSENAAIGPMPEANVVRPHAPAPSPMAMPEKIMNG